MSLENAAISFADSNVFDERIVRNALETLPPTDPNYLRAHIIYSASQFWLSGKEGQINAVQSVKDRYRYSLEHGYKETEAYALNQLVRYAIAASDRAVTEEVFKDEFASLYTSNDIPASLARLSQKSIEIYPTSDAHLSYASSIAYSLPSDYLGKKKLSDSERATILEVVRDSIASAELLFARDAASDAYQFFGTSYPVQYYYTRGQLFGLLALYDHNYIREMEESFNRAIDASHGSDARLFVNGTLPHLYLTRALVTHIVAPEKEDVVRASAAAIASIVQSDPEGTKFFVQYLRGIGRNPALGGLLTPDNANALSRLDIGFKNLLMQAGWKLDA